MNCEWQVIFTGIIFQSFILMSNILLTYFFDSVKIASNKADRKSHQKYYVVLILFSFDFAISFCIYLCICHCVCHCPSLRKRRRIENVWVAKCLGVWGAEEVSQIGNSQTSPAVTSSQHSSAGFKHHINFPGGVTNIYCPFPPPPPPAQKEEILKNALIFDI